VASFGEWLCCGDPDDVYQPDANDQMGVDNIANSVGHGHEPSSCPKRKDLMRRDGFKVYKRFSCAVVSTGKQYARAGEVTSTQPWLST